MKLISEKNSAEAVEFLRAGKIVAYPTETSYGFGCDATNPEAVNKIFAIKGREAGKPLLVVVADIEQIKPYIIWDERLENINAKYWPGPLTVIVPVKIPSGLAVGVLSSDNCLAFRITSHPIARELVINLGKPLVSTSANKAGDPSLFSAQDIVEKFSNELAQPDVIIAGNLPIVPGSTIIKLVPEGFLIIRQGDIHFEL